MCIHVGSWLCRPREGTVSTGPGITGAVTSLSSGCEALGLKNTVNQERPLSSPALPFLSKSLSPPQNSLLILEVCSPPPLCSPQASKAICPVPTIPWRDLGYRSEVDWPPSRYCDQRSFFCNSLHASALVLLWFVCFSDRVSGILCWPWVHCVAGDNLEFLILLHLPPELTLQGTPPHPLMRW